MWEGFMTRNVHINIVGKVIGVVETRRTNILGREENLQESQKWKCLKKRQRKKGQQNSG